MVRAKEVRLVGRTKPTLDWLRQSRFHQGSAAQLSAARRSQRIGEHFGYDTVHFAGRLPRLDLRAKRCARRALADALRTVTVHNRQSVISATVQPSAPGMQPERESLSPSMGRSTVSVYHHHVPIDGASHGRWYVALGFVAFRTPT